MFTYLRYFSAISFVGVVVAAIFVGIYFRSTAADDLRDVVHKNNVSLAQGFINTTWKHHRRVLEALQAYDVKDWQRFKQFIDFSQDSFRYFEEIPVAKLNLYTVKGARFLSTDPSEIVFFDQDSVNIFKTTLSGGEDKLILDKAKSGITSSRLVPDGGIRAPDGSVKRGSLVQTMVPIVSDSYVPVVAGSTAKIEGMIEIFYDITPQWDRLYQFQMVGTFGIILIFLILFAALILTARRAEHIIAKQHEKNLDLAAAAARAEAASREKSQFLANISHELRTPLNAIIGFSDIIKNETLGPIAVPQYKDYIHDIHSSGSHLLSLINDILDYSKAEAGRLELEIAEVEVGKTIKTSIRLVEPRAEAGKVILAMDIPKEPQVLKTDGKKLKQVLLNLLSNAVKFTPAGGQVKVSSWHNLADDSVSIVVQDTGIGIAPKDIPKAMTPFGQVDSELSRKYEGTGLGLPLTKKFVETMGGRFEITSELGVGTTITITLPRVAPEKFWKKGSNVAAKPVS